MSLPFAYDAQIDTLAYMSCSEMAEGSYEPRAYFTFRAGAYSSSTGGLGMTPDFFAQTQYYTNTDRGNSLSEAFEQQLQHATEFVHPLAQRFPVAYGTDTVPIGHELDDFLPVLDSPEIAGTARISGARAVHQLFSRRCRPTADGSEPAFSKF